MPRFVVLLRGVNVGKGKRVPIAAFKSMLEGLGYTEVATLLNSGNATFSSTGRSAAKHAQRITEALAATMGVHAAAVAVSGPDFGSIVAANPIDVPAEDHSRFLVAFANDPASLSSLAPLQDLVQPPERFVIGQKAAYLHCAAGILDSKAATALLGKAGRSVTTRNWATTLKLLALCAEPSA